MRTTRGGTYQYIPNGRLNIEFEAKVLNDMTEFANPAGNTFAVSTPQYFGWVADMTANGTKYPATIDNNQYFDYLDDFSIQTSYSGNVYYGLAPGALFELVTSSSCPK
ncbi:hypothetical protein DYBT9275_05479 [Dyadobacter sp. CECT 9275]|uniref:Uncharacterized protein n=1 Tax=Dyadobacter helix TaxID=2822344 RepID=A0A916NNN5_9BACT|nr:hypothetical protein [Dyadobacter sp. CECT 9275]CAG5016113.1 hypothetical protein DYBT9275_05479 [Dyadobacter sp. CECT 9275]